MIVKTCGLNLETELAKNVETLLRVETADLETVLNHYGITPESLSKMMKSIKEWYAKQAHLPQGHLHDRFILGHLMNRGFSVQRAKWNIDNFYTARRRMPELLSERNLADSSWLWYWQRFYFVLPKKTAENYRITLFRMDRECCDIIVTQVVKVALLRSEYRIWNDFALGDRWIIDLKHTTMQQALQLTPVLISKIIYFWKSCYSVKLASVHIINMPSYCATVFNLFKKGLNAKLTARIHIIKAEELLEIFPKDVLPKEYGGTEPSCQEIADEWVKTCQSEPWRKYLMEQDHILTDESKRLTKGKADEIFGVDGSFRQLNVD